ncbi:MAG: tetratricopeptide repeat protein, partial [Granulosicoccaceae bacterium]
MPNKKINKVIPLLTGLLLLFGHVLIAAPQTADPLTQRIIEINRLYEAKLVGKAEELAKQTIDNKAFMQAAAPALQFRAYLVHADLMARKGAYGEQVATLQTVLQKLAAWNAANSREALQVHNQLAQAYEQLGQEQEAITELHNALQLAKAILKPDDLVNTELRLALARLYTNRYALAEAEQQIAMASAIVKDRSDTPARVIQARVLQAQGELAFRETRTRDAADYYRQALQRREKLLGDASIETAQSTVSLASAMKGLHDFVEAEELYRGGFAIYESQVGIEHPIIATLLNNIGQMYYLQGRYADAEKVLQRALEIKRKFFAPGTLSLAETYNHLGYLYYLQKKDAEAANMFDQAIAIWSKPEYERTRYRMSAAVWRAVIKARQGQEEQALRELQEYLQVLIGIYGRDSVAVAQVHQEIAHIQQMLGKQDAAEQSYQQGLRAAASLGNDDRLELILISGDLAALQAERGDLETGLDTARNAIQGMQKRIDRYSGARAQKLINEIASLREAAITHVDIVARLLESKQTAEQQALLDESFATAQIARSSNVALALSRMAQRFAAGNGPLAGLVRQQQELQLRWQEIDGLLVAAIEKPPAERNTATEVALRSSLKQVEQKLATVTARIEQRFPEYAALARPAVLGIKQVQQLLKKDEALVVYLLGETQGFAWSVTANSADLHRVAIGTVELSDAVKDLRTYLTPDAISQLSDIRPVPMALAHGLYTRLMAAPLADIGKAVHVMVVADGAMQSLPLSVLVTRLPDKPVQTLEQHKDVAWLAKEKAVSVLPDVGSLRM